MSRHRLCAGLFALALTSQVSCSWALDNADIFRAVMVDDEPVMIDYLIRNGDPNQVLEVRHEAALIVALREDSQKVFKLLIDTPGIAVNVQAANGDTPLMLAAYKQNLPAVRALLAKGAQVNRPGWSALHYAAAMGDSAIMALLLEKSAAVDAVSPNHTTPLMMAARDGHGDAIKLLLKAGADRSLRNDGGFSALDFALMGNHQAEATLLDPR